MDFFIKCDRETIIDHEITGDLKDVKFDRHIFERVCAKGIIFTKVSFTFAIFDNCYFRDCKFIDCNFTGAKFNDTNLRASIFDGSKFDYCRFSKTSVPVTIIDKHMPGYENVASELARSLRVNYSQLGNVTGVNKAIKAELDATKTHLWKAAWSKESYYRHKYKGLARAKQILEYFWFKLLDFLWGNGESPLKLLRTIFFLIAFVAFCLWYVDQPLKTVLLSPFSLFLGTSQNYDFPEMVKTIATLARYILLGMFVSILVKRLSRR